MYETTRQPPRPGSAAAPGRRPPRIGARGARGCPADGLLPDVGQPVAYRGGGWRVGRPSTQATPRPATTAEGPAANATPPVAAERRHRTRVQHRSLDLAAGRPGHRSDLRGHVSPRPRLEDPPGRGLELPEARAPGEGARRDRHPAVADRALAPYKKTPAVPVESSSSSTRAALCSSRWSAAPGRPGARRRCSASGTAGTASRRSAPSRWRRPAPVPRPRRRRLQPHCGEIPNPSREESHNFMTVPRYTKGAVTDRLPLPSGTSALLYPIAQTVYRFWAHRAAERKFTKKRTDPSLLITSAGDPDV